MSEEIVETPVEVAPEETVVVKTPANVSPEETEDAVADVKTVDTAEETPVVKDTLVPTSIKELSPKMKLNGLITRLELYGAFVDVGVGTLALVHISQIGKKHVNRVVDVLTVGDKVDVWVKKVDFDRKQIMVSMIQPLGVEWRDLKKGNEYTGKITRLETYGAFVNIGAEREGLVHISELSHNYVKIPSELYKVGDEVKVQVLGFSKRKRRIDLSVKALQEKPELTESITRTLDTSKTGTWKKRTKKRDKKPDRNRKPEKFVTDFDDDGGQLPTAMEMALRSAMGSETIDAIATSKKKGRNRKHKQISKKQQADLLERTLMQSSGDDS